MKEHPRTRAAGPLKQFAAATQLIHQKARTVPELSELLGAKQETVSRYLKLLEEEGLLDDVTEPRPPGKHWGRWPKRFAWNKNGNGVEA